MGKMIDVWEKLEKAFHNSEIEEELKSMGITLRGYTIHVKVQGEKEVYKISPEDVISYYAYQAGNISSGCRTLGGIIGDWRPVNELAKTCLQIYKVIKKDELKTIAHKFNMELRED